MIPRPPSPRGTGAVALVESPLQLLMAVEAASAGHAPRPLTVHVRRGVPALTEAARAFAGLDLPHGVVLRHRGALATQRAGWGRGALVLGDAFSGRAQTLVVAREQRSSGARIVVVDDGLATAHLARVLADPARRPLVRPESVPSPRRDALGRVARDALLAAAARGRLRLVTAFAPDPDVAAALERLGVEVVPASLGWAGRQLPQGGDASLDEPVVVVGSALVADGLLRQAPYLAWVRAHAASGPVRYLPHRRELPEDLARIATLPGVVLDRAGLPVELRLAALRPPQRVVALPTSALTLLPAVLAPGVLLTARVPDDDWWRPEVPHALRAHLSDAAQGAAPDRVGLAGDRD